MDINQIDSSSLKSSVRHEPEGVEVTYDPEIFRDLNPMFRYIFNLLGGFPYSLDYSQGHLENVRALMQKPKQAVVPPDKPDENKNTALDLMYYLSLLHQSLLQSQDLVGTDFKQAHQWLNALITQCTRPENYQDFVSLYNSQNAFINTVFKYKEENCSRGLSFHRNLENNQSIYDNAKDFVVYTTFPGEMDRMDDLQSHKLLQIIFRRMVISLDPLKAVYERGAFAHFHEVYQQLGGAIGSYHKGLDEFLRDGVGQKLETFKAIRTLKQQQKNVLVNLFMEHEYIILAFCYLHKDVGQKQELTLAAQQAQLRLKMRNSEYVEDTIRLLEHELFSYSNLYSDDSSITNRIITGRKRAYSEVTKQSISSNLFSKNQKTSENQIVPKRDMHELLAPKTFLHPELVQMCLAFHNWVKCPVLKCYGVRIGQGQQFKGLRAGDFLVTFAVAWGTDGVNSLNDPIALNARQDKVETVLFGSLECLGFIVIDNQTEKNIWTQFGSHLWQQFDQDVQENAFIFMRTQDILLNAQDQANQRILKPMAEQFVRGSKESVDSKLNIFQVIQRQEISRSTPFTQQSRLKFEENLPYCYLAFQDQSPPPYFAGFGSYSSQFQPLILHKFWLGLFSKFPSLSDLISLPVYEEIVKGKLCLASLIERRDRTLSLCFNKDYEVVPQLELFQNQLHRPEGNHRYANTSSSQKSTQIVILDDQNGAQIDSYAQLLQAAYASEDQMKLNLMNDDELQTLAQSGYFQDNFDMNQKQEMVRYKQSDFDPNTSLKAILDNYANSRNPTNAQRRFKHNSKPTEVKIINVGTRASAFQKLQREKKEKQQREKIQEYVKEAQGKPACCTCYTLYQPKVSRNWSCCHYDNCLILTCGSCNFKSQGYKVRAPIINQPTYRENSQGVLEEVPASSSQPARAEGKTCNYCQKPLPEDKTQLLSKFQEIKGLLEHEMEQFQHQQQASTDGSTSPISQIRNPNGGGNMNVELEVNHGSIRLCINNHGMGSNQRKRKDGK